MIIWYTRLVLHARRLPQSSRVLYHSHVFLPSYFSTFLRLDRTLPAQSQNNHGVSLHLALSRPRHPFSSAIHLNLPQWLGLKLLSASDPYPPSQVIRYIGTTCNISSPPPYLTLLVLPISSSIDHLLPPQLITCLSLLPPRRILSRATALDHLPLISEAGSLSLVPLRKHQLGHQLPATRRSLTNPLLLKRAILSKTIRLSSRTF